jgi:hypothetical protein
MNTDVLPRLSSGEMLRHLVKFDRIGVKWAGTIGETKTKDYLYHEMTKLGLDTRVDDFPYLKYSSPETTVAITAPVQKELNCNPVSYVANKEVEGEAVFVGKGTRQEFELVKQAGVDFSDKIVVAISDAPFMLTPFVEEYGAPALLTISLTPDPGICRHCCGAFYKCTAFPTMPSNVSDFVTKIVGAMVPIDPDANMLLTLMSVGKVRIKITNKATYEPATSWNIISELKGKEKPEETVIVGAHYDSEFNVPGVCDNGSGCAGVLEIARAIKAADTPLTRTMVFAFWGCEENGCWGSAAYVARHQDDLSQNCIAMLNLDATTFAGNMAHTLWVSQEMKDLMVEAADALKWKVHYITGVEPTFSDYAPFRDIDIPTVWCWHYPPAHPYYHTEKDTLEFLPTSITDLVASTEVTALAALELATTDRRLK